MDVRYVLGIYLFPMVDYVGIHFRSSILRPMRAMIRSIMHLHNDLDQVKLTLVRSCPVSNLSHTTHPHPPTHTQPLNTPTHKHELTHMYTHTHTYTHTPTRHTRTRTHKHHLSYLFFILNRESVFEQTTITIFLFLNIAMREGFCRRVYIVE